MLAVVVVVIVIAVVPEQELCRVGSFSITKISDFKRIGKYGRIKVFIWKECKKNDSSLAAGEKNLNQWGWKTEM